MMKDTKSSTDSMKDKAKDMMKDTKSSTDSLKDKA